MFFEKAKEIVINCKSLQKDDLQLILKDVDDIIEIIAQHRLVDENQLDILKCLSVLYYIKKRQLCDNVHITDVFCTPISWAVSLFGEQFDNIHHELSSNSYKLRQSDDASFIRLCVFLSDLKNNKIIDPYSQFLLFKISLWTPSKYNKLWETISNEVTKRNVYVD